MAPSIYQVVAQYRAKDGRADSVADSLRELAAVSRHETGNIDYVVSRSLEDTDHFVIVETYGARRDFDAHRASEHFTTITIDRILPDLISRTVHAFVGTGIPA